MLKEVLTSYNFLVVICKKMLKISVNFAITPTKEV